jgi:hypothetical protein
VHGQLQQVSSKLEQQQAAAAKAVAEECERHLDEERALQQQLQQLKSDLAVAQVRGARPGSSKAANRMHSMHCRKYLPVVGCQVAVCFVMLYLDWDELKSDGDAAACAHAAGGSPHC